MDPNKASRLKPSLRYFRTSATGSCTTTASAERVLRGVSSAVLHPVEEERVVCFDVVGRLQQKHFHAQVTAL